MTEPQPVHDPASLGHTVEPAADLLPIVYEDLRSLAVAYLARESAGHTLQPTALVHEAWLRLADAERDRWSDHRHYLVTAARAMRRALVDHARSRGRDKRGGNAARVTLDVASFGTDAPQVIDLLALEEAMQQLAALDPVKAQLVELRFFGGMPADQAAEVLGMARSTAAEQWRLARAWLGRRLRATDETAAAGDG